MSTPFPDVRQDRKASEKTGIDQGELRKYSASSVNYVNAGVVNCLQRAVEITLYCNIPREAI